MVGKIRQYYVKLTGERQAFISVAHDVWDGKMKQINGLTTFFIDPTDFCLYRIPLALTKPLGKSAMELSKTCMLGLEKFGIEIEDAFRSINDNCTTAKRAGRL